MKYWRNWWHKWGQSLSQTDRQTDKLFDTIYRGMQIFSFSYFCYLPTRYPRRGINWTEVNKTPILIIWDPIYDVFLVCLLFFFIIRLNFFNFSLSFLHFVGLFANLFSLLLCSNLFFSFFLFLFHLSLSLSLSPRQKITLACKLPLFVVSVRKCRFIHLE